MLINIFILMIIYNNSISTSGVATIEQIKAMLQDSRSLGAPGQYPEMTFFKSLILM